jgi:CheY-like chemotaxis protein/HPt (histidine-containing phosphotransfer) domain-containing protein
MSRLFTGIQRITPLLIGLLLVTYLGFLLTDLYPSRSELQLTSRARLFEDDYLTKPVVMEELHDTLVALISGQLQQTDLVTRHTVRESQAHFTILVVDDVEINREMLLATLEKQGHRVMMADNGLEAVDRFSQAEFDIIFMDMQMPVLDGYGAVRQIREIERVKALKRTPIVAMTAYAMQGDREKCLAADMDEYLSKPARPAEIIEMLHHLVPGDGILLKTSPAIQTSQTNSGDSLPVFDRDELLERLGGREDAMGRFIEMFVRNVAVYMESLISAIERGDGEQMRIQAHTIKGAAGNISAHRVRETAATMEADAREGRLEESACLLQRLKDDIQEFNKNAGVQ